MLTLPEYEYEYEYEYGLIRLLASGLGGDFAGLLNTAITAKLAAL